MDLSATVDSEEFGEGVEYEWVIVTISLIVIGVGLIIYCDLYFEYVGLCVLRNLAFDEGGADGCRLDINVLFFGITKSALNLILVLI